MQSVLSVMFVLAVGVASDGCQADATGVDPDAATSDPSGKDAFDLTLDLTAKVENGDPYDFALWSIAVRDQADGKLVAFESQHVGEEASTFHLSARGVMRRGATYAIGVTTADLPSCLLQPSSVWFEQTPAVTGDVVVSRTFVQGQGPDLQGCDVLHESVGLPAGTYTAATPILGDAANHLELVVSASGRVYAQRVFVLCSDTACTPSLESPGPACSDPVTPAAGQSTFALANSGSASQLSGTATIDKASQSIRFQGDTTTWTSPTFSTVCCTDSIDATLVRASASTTGCQ